MKKIIYFSAIILLLIFVACGKDEGLTLPNYKGKFIGNLFEKTYKNPIDFTVTNNQDTIVILSVSEDSMRTNKGFIPSYKNAIASVQEEYWVCGYSSTNKYYGYYKLSKKTKQIVYEYESYNGGKWTNEARCTYNPK